MCPKGYLNKCPEGYIMHYSKEIILSKPKRSHKNKQQSFNDNNAINFTHEHKKRNLELIPKTQNQEKYILDLLDPRKEIVIGYGPAGTGKTYLAMQAAVKAFRNHEVERIILTRPAVGVEDEKHGFLPGTLEQKMAPWVRPLFDVLREYYSVKDITHMMDEQIIEISPLAFMRGRTFKNSIIIADEMQNATPGQMKMLLTRIGEGSKIVVTGDVEQADKSGKNNGLLDLHLRLTQGNVNGISLCEFKQQDIQRHRIIENVLNLYSES